MLVAVLIALVLSGVLCGVMLYLIRQQVRVETMRDLARDGRRVATAIKNGTLTPEIRAPGGELLEVTDRQGRVIAASPRMRGREPPRLPPLPLDVDRRDTRRCGVDAPGGPCFLIVEFQVGIGPSAKLVYSLAPEPGLAPEPLQAALAALSVPLITGLVGYATWLSANRTLRPVNAIRRELDEITATDLERRVPVPPRRDEVGLLAESINATLDRLEQAVARQRGFVSDVSHELRSPLAALRMEVELALSAPEEADVQETLQAVLENTERLSAVVDDLLALARLEADRNFPREVVDLPELADEEVLRRPRRTQVTVLSEGAVRVEGGRSELARLLTNLLDNADRHAASEVTMILRTEPPATAVVEVIDDGPGVPPQDRERVFERFTRLAEGRHRDAGGTGLGLAISRDIATAHQGSLVLTDRLDGRSGARFVLRLPAAPSTPDDER
ncbi:Signal transduction histidine kinase [Actinomadura meyerae]|jgi:signal transduction histidine kinase|uniref:histidine kinase n=1 Tax=Actinomadura meyerae TaxID=240840 RepID=A0A239JFH1_9ACTN|nr:ATP-binding protein [Actinomadura meyerae]SNT04168.1 Signal transduction histidine kinase [Actinomadura meyerae]